MPPTHVRYDRRRDDAMCAAELDNTARGRSEVLGHLKLRDARLCVAVEPRWKTEPSKVRPEWRAE